MVRVGGQPLLAIHPLDQLAIHPIHPLDQPLLAITLISRLEPIMLKNLPIIPFQTSQILPIILNLFPNHHLLFFQFYWVSKIMSEIHIKLFGN